jgi:thiamine biosynthesis lipoprotein
MGMAISIDVRAPATSDLNEAIAGCVQWFHWVDETFSTYKSDSAVSRFARGELAPDDMPAALLDVLAQCGALNRATGGYFDAYATGSLDPSGFVKGWSVEVASASLITAGITNHAINAGGDIRVSGGPSPAESWHVGIAHPLVPDALCAVVELLGDNRAIATSGTKERGAHVIDPHTGRAATDLASVTIVGPDLGHADALATAGLAMGLAAPQWLATLEHYEGMCVDAGGYIHATDNFPNVLLIA